MYRNNRLGMVALGISLVALFVAFGSRFDGSRGWSDHRDARQNRGAVTAPQPPAAPEPPAPPAPPRPGPDHGPWRADWNDDGPGFARHGWPLFGPLFVLGHIARFATALLLIGLGLRLLRRSRRDSGDPPVDRPFSA